MFQAHVSELARILNERLIVLPQIYKLSEIGIEVHLWELHFKVVQVFFEGKAIAHSFPIRKNLLQRQVELL